MRRFLFWWNTMAAAFNVFVCGGAYFQGRWAMAASAALFAAISGIAAARTAALKTTAERQGGLYGERGTGNEQPWTMEDYVPGQWR